MVDATMVVATISNIGISLLVKKKEKATRISGCVSTKIIRKEISTNMTCEMRSTNVYSAFDARNTPEDTVDWLAIEQTARDAVQPMKLAVLK